MRKATMIMLAAAAGTLGVARADGTNKTSWAENLTIKGDMRLRFESIDEDGKDVRERLRIRARLAAEAKVTDEVSAGIGLSTSENNDPISSNITLDSGSSRKDIFLDLGYIDFHPAAVNGLSIVGGKMKMPFITVRDLLWDSDLNPEGAAAQYVAKGDAGEITATVADFVQDERSTGSDAYTYAGQLAAKLKVGDKATLTVGGSDYFHDGLEGEAVIDHATTDPTKVRSFGNQTIKTTEVDADGTETVTEVLYATGFNLIEGFAILDLKLALPVSLYADYVVNADADAEDTGYLGGLKLGKAKDAGTWEMDYNYRDVEANAVVGAFSDSDAFGGGTDGEGHRVAVAYAVAKNVKSQVAYFMGEKSSSKGGTDYTRLQVDLSVAF